MDRRVLWLSVALWACGPSGGGSSDATPPACVAPEQAWLRAYAAPNFQSNADGGVHSSPTPWVEGTIVSIEQGGEVPFNAVGPGAALERVEAAGRWYTLDTGEPAVRFYVSSSHDLPFLSVGSRVRVEGYITAVLDVYIGSGYIGSVEIKDSDDALLLHAATNVTTDVEDSTQLRFDFEQGESVCTDGCADGRTIHVTNDDEEAQLSSDRPAKVGDYWVVGTRWLDGHAPWRCCALCWGDSGIGLLYDP